LGGLGCVFGPETGGKRLEQNGVAFYPCYPSFACKSMTRILILDFPQSSSCHDDGNDDDDDADDDDDDDDDEQGGGGW
jgi:hypothetical protein